MRLRSIDLNLLVIFDAVMRHRNLTRAGEDIGMSQPAISAALSRLRGLLQDELFVRSSHGMRPTPRSEHFAKSIRHILDLVGSAFAEVDAFDPVVSRRAFNLALSAYGEVLVLPRLMQGLAGMGSAVVVNAPSIAPDTVPSALRTGSIDLYLGGEPLPHDDFVNAHVIDETIVSLVRHGHPAAKTKPGLDAFLAMPHVAFEKTNPQFWQLERVFQRTGKMRRVASSVHSLYVMPYLVAGSDLVCSLPIGLARRFARMHALDIVAMPDDGQQVPLYLIWHRRMETDPGHRWIRTTVAAMLRDPEAGFAPPDRTALPEISIN